VFLEQDVDHTIGRRYDRWWAAHGQGGTVYLPLVMVDSGHRFSSGPVDFHSVYSGMVEAELARTPGADLESTSFRVGNRLQFSGRMTNHSGVTLSSTGNDATFHALVYEEVSAGSTGRVIRAAVSSPITADLPDGDAVAFAMETPDLSGVNWDNLHSVVFADYRPEGSLGAYDMLQAALPSQAGGSNTILFSHIAVGGGWNTSLTLANTGADPSSGNLTFIGQDGHTISVTLNESATPPKSALGSTGIGATGLSFPVSVPAGSTRVFSAGPLDPGKPPTIGWAKLDYKGGQLDGAATFQFSNDGVPSTIAGVFASKPTEFATIPIDNDESQKRFTGFAIANPSDENISISVVILNMDGTMAESIAPPELNPLGPQRQVAKFLHEYLPLRASFRGSMVLVAQGGQKFVVVALAQNKGLYTAIPVIPTKAPNVPN